MRLLRPATFVFTAVRVVRLRLQLIHRASPQLDRLSSRLGNQYCKYNATACCAKCNLIKGCLDVATGWPLRAENARRRLARGAARVPGRGHCHLLVLTQLHAAGHVTCAQLTQAKGLVRVREEVLACLTAAAPTQPAMACAVGTGGCSAEEGQSEELQHRPVGVRATPRSGTATLLMSRINGNRQASSVVWVT